MSKLKDKLDKLKENLVTLKFTKTITEEDLVLPEWTELRSDYNEITAAIDKAVVSIKNSIIFQRRLVFCLTRDSVRDLVTNDKNWKKAGLKNDNYTAVIKLLIDSGLVIELKKGGFKQPSVYRASDKDLRKYLLVDEKQQESEAIEFVKKFEKKSKGDNKGDTVVSSKYIEDSSKQEEDSNKLKEVSNSSKNEFKSNVTETVLADREESKTDSSGISMTDLKAAHQDILNKALSIPADRLNRFQCSFLQDKQGKLNKYGSFTAGQLKILNEIISIPDRPSPSSAAPLPQLNKETLESFIKNSDSAEELIGKLQTVFFKDGNKVFETVLSRNFFELKFNERSDWEKIATFLKTDIPENIESELVTFKRRINERKEFHASQGA